MSWIAEPHEDEPTGEVAAAYGRDVAARGYVANYTRVFAHRPPVLAAWAGLNGAIKASMDPRRYELATVAAALRLRSTYCSVVHGTLLAERYVGTAAVVAVAQGRDPASLSEVDRAVVRLADTVAAGAADMSEADLAELRGLGLPDDEILEVVFAAAARCFFSTVLDAVGAQTDAAYQGVEPELRDALTVGRPITPAAGA